MPPLVVVSLTNQEEKAEQMEAADARQAARGAGRDAGPERGGNA